MSQEGMETTRDRIPWDASSSACCFAQSFNPFHSWITTMAGSLALPFVAGVNSTPETVSSPLLYETVLEVIFASVALAKTPKQMRVTNSKIIRFMLASLIEIS